MGGLCWGFCTLSCLLGICVALKRVFFGFVPFSGVEFSCDCFAFFFILKRRVFVLVVLVQ